MARQFLKISKLINQFRVLNSITGIESSETVPQGKRNTELHTRAMPNPEAQPPSHVHLWPIAKAAQVAGLTPKLLVSAVGNGDMPGVEILLLGQRGRRFVRAASLMAYLDAPRIARSGKAAR